MPAVAIFLGALLSAAFFPEVEDPWPDRIGIEFMFTAAGAGGVLAGIYHGKSPNLVREEAITRGGRAGFYGGLSVYLISLVVQLLSLQ